MLAVLAGIAGTILRFLPRSGMWLDEALSTNISALPMTEIPHALRSDGHPPLYYWVLHLWSQAGSSDWWLRALSGVISLVGLPLAYLAGRRLGRRKGSEGLGGHRVGLIAVSLWALLPFAVRYGSETRMYALVSTLVLAGYLAVDALLGEPRRTDLPRSRPLGSAAALALITAALLLTHYWALWLGASVAVLALVVLVRSVSPDRRRGAWWCLGALAIGLVLYSPWIPNMAYQAQHTGTPWGEVFRPATILVVTITDFVGGGFGELQIASYLLFTAIAVAVFGALRTRAGRPVIEVVALPQARILPELSVFLGTLAIGWGVSALSSSTYASRYAAVIAPLFVLCVAGGFAMARTTRATTLITAFICAALVVGSVAEVVTDRTQADVVADAVATDIAATGGPSTTAGGPDASTIVVVCPDQLAPATVRALEHLDVNAPVVAFPDPAADTHFVNWVDYADRNAAVDPAGFVADLDIGADDTVYAVINTTYRGVEGLCEGVLNTLGAEGGGLEQLVTADADNFFEGMSLWVRRPAP